MIKIYYEVKDDYYTFKFYSHGILVVSGLKRPDNSRIGNKRRSGKIEIIFMNSHLYNSTGRMSRKPELNLWDKYLKSFWISKEVFIGWLDQYITYLDYYYIYMKELKNKIK